MNAPISVCLASFGAALSSLGEWTTTQADADLDRLGHIEQRLAAIANWNAPHLGATDPLISHQRLLARLPQRSADRLLLLDSRTQQLIDSLVSGPDRVSGLPR